MMQVILAVLALTANMGYRSEGEGEELTILEECEIKTFHFFGFDELFGLFELGKVPGLACLAQVSTVLRALVVERLRPT